MDAAQVELSRVAAAEVVALHRELVARGESPEAAQRQVLGRVVRLLRGQEPQREIAWTRVHPAILGAIYEQCLARPERHARGVHFTGEDDIASVVEPTIEAPWRRRIAAANTVEEFLSLHAALLRFTVLDPACGSGNFLYAALLALRRIEALLLARLQGVAVVGRVRAIQCRGIDRSALVAELARVMLQIADGTDCAVDVQVGDALFMDWREVDAVVGNPPFVAKNKLVPALGRAYVDALRAAYPGVSGRADYCVYFFRKAHDALKLGGRAGLIGTNTIRQNDSRAGGLDHVVANGGIIKNAVASRVWPGEALVHVSVVNWVKGDSPEPCVLARQFGDGPDGVWDRQVVGSIGASLSASDVTRAAVLACNLEPKNFYQGQTHGCAGLLVTPRQAAALGCDVAVRGWLVPTMIGEDLLGAGRPSRFAIDLSRVEDLSEVRPHRALMRRLEREVLPEVRRKAAANPHDRGRQAHLLNWWKFWRARLELVERLAGLRRYIVCVRVTRRPIFAFVAAGIRPSDALQAFTFADDYSFGVLQSNLHWRWFTERCSTLKNDFRYTSETVWSSFPWPQAPSRAAVLAVAEAGRALRAARDSCVQRRGSLRAVYRALADEPALRDCHASLDAAVAAAYGWAHGVDGLTALMALNAAIAADECAGRSVQGPGIPAGCEDAGLYSGDCVDVSPRVR